MNFKNALQIFIIAVFLFFSLGTCLIHIEEINTKFIGMMKKSTNGSKETNSAKKICNFAFSDSYLIQEVDMEFNVKRLQDLSFSTNLFLLYNTRNQLNYTNYIKPYNSSFLEIWQNKNCDDDTLFLVREIVIKMVQSYEPCPKNPIYIFQSHIYCMIKNYMIQGFNNKQAGNCFLELTKIANIFFLAEKQNRFIVPRLVLECDAQNKFTGYNLSAIRILNKVKKPLYDNNFTKKKLKNEISYFNDPILQHIIRTFKIEQLRCNIKFFIYENSNDDMKINRINNFNANKQLDQHQLNNKTLFVISSEKDISNYVNETSLILANLNISNENEFTQIFNDDEYEEESENFFEMNLNEKRDKKMNNSNMNCIIL